MSGLLVGLLSYVLLYSVCLSSRNFLADASLQTTLR